jgi:hypothetical protein
MFPGHGRVSHREDLDAMLCYMDDIMRFAHEAIASGQSLEQLVASPVPEKYRTWLFPDFYPENLDFLYKKMSSR